MNKEWILSLIFMATLLIHFGLYTWMMSKINSKYKYNIYWALTPIYRDIHDDPKFTKKEEIIFNSLLTIYFTPFSLIWFPFYCIYKFIKWNISTFTKVTIEIDAVNIIEKEIDESINIKEEVNNNEYV